VTIERRVIRIRALYLLSVLVLAACGRSATQPSDTRPPAPPIATFMAPGRYFLSLVISSNGMEGLQPPCTITFSADLTGTLPQPITGFIVTAVSDRTGGLRIRPEPPFDMGLEVRLRASATGVTGTARGVARDLMFPQTVVVDGGTPESDAALSGTFGFNHNDVGGPVKGRVIFDNGDGNTYSCPFNDWIMNRMQ
jgi:hypothetical protein